MTILDKTKIGNKVQINLELSEDRLNKEIIDAVKLSSKGIISDFKITDGKGIGVVLKLSNGKEQWFFENEIDILDENENVMNKDIASNENHNLLYEVIKDIKYENKNKISDLINPINLIEWIIVSFKDIF